MSTNNTTFLIKTSKHNMSHSYCYFRLLKHWSDSNRPKLPVLDRPTKTR